MLDTNIFCWLREGRIQISDLPTHGPLVVTNIQLDELNLTRNSTIKAKLLDVFSAIAPEIHPTETFLVDVSRVDIDRMGSGELFNQIRQALNTLNKSKPNNVQDALIGEVAILRDFTLITSDKDLAEVVQKHRGKVIFFSKRSLG